MNILIVEDETIIAEALIVQLTNWNQDALAATSVKEAEAAFAEQNFDLVLLDIVLPDGFGYELIPTFKKKRPDINIITMTGHNTPELERTVRRLGITYYMSKPVNNNELKSIINHISNKQS